MIINNWIVYKSYLSPSQWSMYQDEMVFTTSYKSSQYDIDQIDYWTNVKKQLLNICLSQNIFIFRVDRFSDSFVNCT